MKIKFTVVAIVCLTLNLPAQTTKQLDYSDLLSLAKSNLVYLDKGKGLTPFYRIDYTGIKIDLGKDTEQFIPATALPRVVSFLETQDISQLAKVYQAKNISSYIPPIRNKVYEPVPTSIEGLVVAIDPGHFANDYRTAVLEDKWVLMKGSNNEDIKFYEAELTDLTALLVETKLMALGAKPFRSRGMGVSSFGKTFKDWMATELRKSAMDNFRSGAISKKQFDELMIFSKDSIYVLRSYFNNRDLRNRSEVINSRDPDLTISIHYNAKEGGRRENKYLNPVDENYSMAFVPGAFMGNEVNKLYDRVDFLRLLLSTDMDKSMRLAHLILNAQRATTGILPVANDQIKLDDHVCTKSDYEGVFLRNLAMTRLSRGPMVYLEALLQDNKEMASQLAVKDYEFNHPDYGKLRAPKICERVAQGTVDGILSWLEENKSYLTAKQELKTN